MINSLTGTTTGSFGVTNTTVLGFSTGGITGSCGSGSRVLVAVGVGVGAGVGVAVGVGVGVGVRVGVGVGATD